MKSRKLFQTFSLFILLNSSSAFSASITATLHTVRVIPQDTFIPLGFDDNDNVQLTVSGYLPNTCYKAGSATARVDRSEMKIYIQNTVFVSAGCWCAEVIIPYNHTIDLGSLPAGQYEVFVEDQKDIPHSVGSLTVTASNRIPSDN